MTQRMCQPLNKYAYGLILFIFLCVAFSAFAKSLSSLEQLTNNLLRFNAKIRAGKKITSLQSSQQLTAVKARYNMLVNLFQKNPRQAVNYLLPDQISSTLPKAFQPYMEQEIINLTGTFEIRTIIMPGGKDGATQYLLRQKNGPLYYLHFSDKPARSLKPGDIINIQHAFKLSTKEGYNLLLLSSQDLQILKSISKTAIPDAFGPQKTVIFLLNFEDRPDVKPWTPEYINALVFQTIDAMYREFSYKQTHFEGRVLGWYTIPLQNQMNCDAMLIKMPSLAAQAAIDAGEDIREYTRRVYLFPSNLRCNWCGLAIPGKPNGFYSQSWINGCVDQKIIAHELGHNIGLLHSHSLICDGSSTEENCKQMEYGDGADTMGSGKSTHFNAFQKEFLGWLGYGSSPAIKTVASTGQYHIYPYETKGADPSNDIKALKILKKQLPDGSNDYYYLEFRQGIGFDIPLETCGSACDYTKGIILHQGNDSDNNTSNLLDMTPADNPEQVALLPGQTFTDANTPNGKINITTESINEDEAIVSVTIDHTPSCVHSPFSMKVAPAIQWVNPGENTSYTITVTNNDSESCEPVTFNLMAEPNTSWLKTMLGKTALTLAPGKSETVNMTATVSVSAPLAIYGMKVTGESTLSDHDKLMTIEATLGVF